MKHFARNLAQRGLTTLLTLSCAVGALEACGKKEAPPAATEGGEDKGAGTAAEGDGTAAKVVKKGGDEATSDAPGEADPGRHRPVRDRINKRPHPKVPGEETPAPDGAAAKDPAVAGDPAAPKTEPGAPGTVPGPGGVATPPIVPGPAGEAPKAEPGTPGMPGTPGIEIAKTDPGAPPVAGEPLLPTPAGEAPKGDGIVAAAPKADFRNDANGIDASTILPLATVIEITAAKGLEAAGLLPGIAMGTGYGSTYYAATTGGRFGVALQVWQDVSRREADDRYRRMRLQYPNAEDINVMLPLRAFYAYFQGIQTVVFADSSRRMILAIGCGDGICNQEQLVKLAKAARDRL